MAHELVVDTRLTVETPEGVDFQFEIAGPGKRGVAFLIDILIKIGSYFFILWLLVGFQTVATGFSGFGTGLMLTAVFVINWMYSALFEAFMNGQTPGKRLQNLRVVRTNGTPITFFEAFGRNLLLAVDALPVVFFLFGTCLVGVTSIAATRRMQRVGDLVFDTMVIDESSEGLQNPEPFEPPPQKIQRSQCAKRFEVSERTLAIVERLFEKNRPMPPERREEIARILAPSIANRLGYLPPDSSRRSPASAYLATRFLMQILHTFRDQQKKRPATDSRTLPLEELPVVPIAEVNVE